MSRRSVLLGTAVSVLGGVVGFITARNTGAANKLVSSAPGNGYGAAPGGTTGTGSGATPGVLLTPAAKVPEGGGLILKPQKVVVTKDTTGTIHAFSAVCTHLGCLVGSVSGGTINCLCHGSQFNADTGAVVRGPATTPLPSEPIVVKDGNVYGQSGG